MPTWHPGTSAGLSDLRKIVPLDRTPLEAKIGLQPQDLEEFGISCSLNRYLNVRLKNVIKIKKKSSLPKDREDLSWDSFYPNRRIIVRLRNFADLDRP
jgi:hypothetical protein